MDPVTLTTAIITLAGAVCKSYDQISKLVGRIRKASKELQRIRSRAGSINSLVVNLKRALEESATRKVIEKDRLALDHVKALDAPLKAVECTLDEVVEKVMKYYWSSNSGKRYKLRWTYWLNTSDWENLQERLDSHNQNLRDSMDGLITLHVLRNFGAPNKDPASTLRIYAKSILEAPEDQKDTLVGPRTPSPLPDSINDPPAPLPPDERLLLAKKKLQLQQELLQAARGGNYLRVSVLLGEGAETDGTDENEGMTALLLAAKYGHLRVAKILVEAGANIEAESEAFGDEWAIRSEKGRTPLIWAAAGRDCPRMQERMCRFLLDKGAEVNARNFSGRTALQEAAMSASFPNTDPHATMELLLQRGAYVNAYDITGWTALTECGLYGKLKLAELLLLHGAHVDGKPGHDDPSMISNPDLNGGPHESPLVVCAQWSWNEALICLLLEKGADIEGKDKDGKTMQELASDAKRGADAKLGVVLGVVLDQIASKRK